MCNTPILLKKYNSYVPCGRCPKCRSRRVSAWSFRLLQECKVSSSAYFVTLTYDTRFVPITQNGYFGLCPRDLQLFFKRLRKLSGCDDSCIKYYAVGEYGGRTFRPHYHIILFNADIELIQRAWSAVVCPFSVKFPQPIGNIHVAPVNGATIGYTLKYISKDRRNFRLNLNDDRCDEFSRLSKGLGISYLSEAVCDYHAKYPTERMYCTVEDGVKLAMPRYYKDKLFYEHERAQIRDHYEAAAAVAGNKKLDKSSPASARNFDQAMNAAYSKMYSSSFKRKL